MIDNQTEQVAPEELDIEIVEEVSDQKVVKSDD